MNVVCRLISVIALGAVAAPQSLSPVPLALSGERVFFEYSSASRQAVLVVEAESGEALTRVVIAGPNGQPVFELSGPGGELALESFRIETRAARPSALSSTFQPGAYRFEGVACDGSPAHGQALLSPVLLRPPRITYPLAGAGAVPTDGLIVSWAADSRAEGYRIVLEQDENDGLTVELPPGTGSFEVPSGFLRGGAGAKLEVGVRGPGGNISLAEIEFSTQ